MDPKQQLNQLDPKLKEAYERVMGTPVANTPAQPAASAATATPATQPAAPAPATSTPPPPPPTGTAPLQQPPHPGLPVSPTGNPHMQPAASLNPFGTPAQHPASNTAPAQPGHPAAPAKPGATSHGFVAGKKGMHMSPLLLIVGGVIFLLVYTVFWLKFFNIPLPFPVPFLSQ